MKLLSGFLLAFLTFAAILLTLYFGSKTFQAKLYKNKSLKIFFDFENGDDDDDSMVDFKYDVFISYAEEGKPSLTLTFLT
jgi:hypothetical protein